MITEKCIFIIFCICKNLRDLNIISYIVIKIQIHPLSKSCEEEEIISILF